MSPIASKRLCKLEKLKIAASLFILAHTGSKISHWKAEVIEFSTLTGWRKPWKIAKNVLPWASPDSFAISSSLRKFKEATKVPRSYPMLATLICCPRTVRKPSSKSQCTYCSSPPANASKQAFLTDYFEAWGIFTVVSECCGLDLTSAFIAEEKDRINSLKGITLLLLTSWLVQVNGADCMFCHGWGF